MTDVDPIATKAIKEEYKQMVIDITKGLLQISEKTICVGDIGLVLPLQYAPTVPTMLAATHIIFSKNLLK